MGHVDNSKMKIGVIGVGVVGGAMVQGLKERGFQVLAYDHAKPEFNTFPEVLESDMIFLCLPTPTIEGEQKIGAIFKTLNILSSEDYPRPIIIKSTVLPGTTDSLDRGFKNLNLVHNPEFLTERNAHQDLMHQKAILVGSRNKEALNHVAEFWEAFDEMATVLRYNSPLETELAKYIHNCFLAIKVSLMNDFKEMSDCLGIEFQAALSGALALGKIGDTHTLVPGPDGKPGFGGMCFTKDTAALSTFCKDNQLECGIIDAAIKANQGRRGEIDVRGQSTFS